MDEAPLRLVAATANADKLAEMAAILGAAGVELAPRPASVPEVVEDGDSLEANARLKAAAIAAAGGSPAVADDTGLFVAALDGAPGVHSARYAGETATSEDNIDRLLAELGRAGAAGAAGRHAHFETVVVVRHADGSETQARGRVEGHIAEGRRGQGWGYDPVFVPVEGDGRTFAEMTPAEKAAISHRGRALRDLARQLGGGR